MRELKPHMSPDEVLETFRIGNRRFLEGKPQYRDHLGDIKRTALGQTPHAIVLGCIDSRKPAEIVFDKGLGDIFNARVATSPERPVSARHQSHPASLFASTASSRTS